jgi:septation ring formation regulator EzrA
LGSHKDLARKLEDLEGHLKVHDKQIQTIFSAIRQLITQPKANRKKISFHLKERHSPYIARVKKDIQIKLINSNIIVV